MTIQLRLKPDLGEIERYESVRDDVEHWVRDLKARGFEVTAKDVYTAWQRHSERSSAGWLAPYGDNQRDCDALLQHLEPDEGGGIEC